MHESLYGEHTKPEREQHATHKTAETKQSIPSVENANHLPLYAQLQGNDPLPSLRLSCSPQSPLREPVQRQQAEQHHEPVSAPLSEAPHIQRIHTTRIPFYAQMWGHQIPPWLRLSASQQVPDAEESLQRRSEAMPPKDNTTGLPDALKIGVENLSGLSLDNVHVHYNSSAPARMKALAYTQGTEIYVGPGQERHLPHEAWHIVQQMQGRVQPTLQMQDIIINDEKELEHEANIMGARAAARRIIGQDGSPASTAPISHLDSQTPVIQAMFGVIYRKDFVLDERSREKYSLPEGKAGSLKEGTPVSFDVNGRNAINLKVEGKEYEKRQEADPRVAIQYSPKSCFIEAVLMVSESVTGRGIEREVVKYVFDRYNAFDPSLGTDLSKIVSIFDFFFETYQRNVDLHLKVPEVSSQVLSLQGLGQIVNAGYPAIAIFANPNHAVVVDKVEGSLPDRLIYYRDPCNATYVIASELQYSRRTTGRYFVLE